MVFEEGNTNFGWINIKEKWLNLPGKEVGYNDRFKRCNLLMMYNKTMTEDVRNRLILSSNSYSVGINDDIIDFNCFMQLGEYAHKLGPRKENLSEKMAAIVRALHTEIFNKAQRLNYIDERESRKMTSNPRAIAEALRPVGIILSKQVGEDSSFNKGNNNNYYPALKHGFLPRGEALILPIDYIYNFDTLSGYNMQGEKEGSCMSLYMVLGPGDELLTGINIGRRTAVRTESSSFQFTTEGRNITDLDGTTRLVFDQQVSTCFYIAKEKESFMKVAHDLIQVCKSKTKSCMTERMIKELAIIKIGNLIYDAKEPYTEDTSTGEIAFLQNFKFTPLNKWEFVPFAYNSNEFPNTPNIDLKDIITSDDNYTIGAPRSADIICEDERSEIEENDNPIRKSEGLLDAQSRMAVQPLKARTYSSMQRPTPYKSPTPKIIIGVTPTPVETVAPSFKNPGVGKKTRNTQEKRTSHDNIDNV